MDATEGVNTWASKLKHSQAAPGGDFPQTQRRVPRRVGAAAGQEIEAMAIATTATATAMTSHMRWPDSHGVAGASEGGTVVDISLSYLCGARTAELRAE